MSSKAERYRDGLKDAQDKFELALRTAENQKPPSLVLAPGLVAICTSKAEVQFEFNQVAVNINNERILVLIDWLTANFK